MLYESKTENPEKSASHHMILKSRSDSGLPMIIPDASRSYLYTQNENLKKSSFGLP